MFGELGKSQFACYCSQIVGDGTSELYKAFTNNLSEFYYSMGSPANIIIYSARPLILDSITLRNCPKAIWTGPTNGIIYGSNNNKNWTQLTTFTSPSLKESYQYNVTVNADVEFNYFKIQLNGSYTNVLGGKDVIIGKIRLNAKERIETWQKIQ